MKALIYISLMFIAIFGFASCNTTGDNSLKAKVEAQKLKSIFPFSKATKTEIFSYKSSYDTDKPFSIILNDHINNPRALRDVLKSNKLNIKERVILNEQQVQTLAELLYNTKCGDEIKGNCFTARHAIVFYDKNDEPIAITELSLECATASFSKDFSKFDLCESKVVHLTDFLKNLGITYFEEPIL